MKRLRLRCSGSAARGVAAAVAAAPVELRDPYDGTALAWDAQAGVLRPDERSSADSRALILF